MDEKKMQRMPLLSFLTGFLTAVAVGIVVYFFNLSNPQRPVTEESLCDSNGSAYTCAMHPSVSGKTGGTCPLCGMLLTRNPEWQGPLTDWVTLSPEEVARLRVETSEVRRESESAVRIPVIGKIRIDENRRYRQTASLPGRIEQLFVRERGANVRAGQPIASVYSRELIAVVEAYAFQNTSESVLRSARNNLASWGIPEDTIKNMLTLPDYHVPVTIHADFSGTVLDINVREGDHTANTHMGPPTLLYECADLNRVWAVMDVREQDYSRIQKGSVLTFKASGLPGHTFSGTISWFSPVIDQLTHTFSVRATLSNADHLLKPGMSLSGVILDSSSGKELSIPASAVLWTGNHSFVYVRGQDFPSGNHYHIREVVLGGKISDDRYVILEGLSEGEEVVTHGAFQIDAAAQLSGKACMMGEDRRVVSQPIEGRREIAEDHSRNHSGR